MVTLEELRALHLQPLPRPLPRAGEQPRKIPPPVPKKTLMARQKAKMMALSRQSAEEGEKQIYACVIKPKLLRGEETLAGENKGHFSGLFISPVAQKHPAHSCK